MSHVTQELSKPVNHAKNGAHRLAVPIQAPFAVSGVYFIRCGQFVKIGVSIDIASRLKDFEQFNPFPVKCVGYEPCAGGRHYEREAEVHRTLAEHHHKGEWFKLSDEVKQFIRQHGKPWKAEP